MVRGIVKEEYLLIILGYVFLFLHKETYVVGTHKKRLTEALLSPHKICFYREIYPIIFTR